MQKPAYVLWGSELSPFSLKLRALCDHVGLPYRWLPDEGGRLENLRANWRIERAKRARTAQRFPAMTTLDEYPLVPFLLAPDGGVLYDSSSLARWLDASHRHAPGGPLVPKDATLAWVVQLIDEAFDEFGLYLVHHQRWVTSARSNDAGRRLAREFRRVLPPFTRTAFARGFAARQVRRLPYLLSIAPTGFEVPGLPAPLQPPPRPGFPPTHALLDDAWRTYLDAVEAILAGQPFLLGGRFTLADASVYGCLGMNLRDPEANALLQARAPRCHRWLEDIRDRRHVGSQGPLALHPGLQPLLDIIGRTFVPLMRQNAAAFERAVDAGETLFAERAFDKGRALYDGVLLDHPFRAVVKPFQVQVWRDLSAAWAALPAAARDRIVALAPLASPGGEVERG